MQACSTIQVTELLQCLSPRMFCVASICFSMFQTLCFTAAYPAAYGLVSQPYIQQPTLVSQQQLQQQREGDVISLKKKKKTVCVLPQIEKEIKCEMNAMFLDT